jgi:hypothetical protein
MNDKTIIKLLIVSQIITFLLLIYSIYNLNNFMCDIRKSINAERMYTWNIIKRNTGEDPALEATNIKNPIMIKETYICE